MYISESISLCTTYVYGVIGTTPWEALTLSTSEKSLIDVVIVVVLFSGSFRSKNNRRKTKSLSHCHGDFTIRWLDRYEESFQIL